MIWIAFVVVVAAPFLVVWLLIEWDAFRARHARRHWLDSRPRGGGRSRW